MLRYNLNNITDRILFPRVVICRFWRDRHKAFFLFALNVKRDNTWRGRLMAPNGPPAMSAIRSLTEVNRTWRLRGRTSEIDPIRTSTPCAATRGCTSILRSPATQSRDRCRRASGRTGGQGRSPFGASSLSRRRRPGACIEAADDRRHFSSPAIARRCSESREAISFAVCKFSQTFGLRDNY
jgi:hypothetical protein